MDGRGRISALLAAACLGGALTFAALAACAIRSRSGIAAFDPWLALLVFVPLFLLGLVRILFLRDVGARIWAVLALVLGILGVGLLFYLEHSGRLVHPDMRPVRAVDRVEYDG